MKKGIIYTVATTMALAPVTSVVSYPVSAQTVLQNQFQTVKSEIKTPQDFIESFCSLRKIDDKGKVLDEYILITEITEKNYEFILKGKTVFEKLEEQMRLDIDEALDKQMKEEFLKLKKEQKYSSYASMVFDAQEIEKTLFPEKYPPILTPEENKEDLDSQLEIEEEENLDSSEDFQNTDSNNSQEDTDETENQKLENDKEDATEENVDSDKENSNTEDSLEEETKDEIDNSEDADLDKEALEDESIEEIEPLPVYPPVVDINQSIVEKEESKTSEEPVSLLKVDAEPVVQKTIESKVENGFVPETVIKNELRISSGAQAFIDSYLKSAAGNIYVQANTLNYKNILNGLSSWNRLTSKDRREVNSVLKRQAGKTYQTLLKEAQRIQLNGGSGGIAQNVPNRVNTATANHVGIYGVLMGTSIAMAGYLLNKRKELDKRS